MTLELSSSFVIRNLLPSERSTTRRGSEDADICINNYQYSTLLQARKNMRIYTVLSRAHIYMPDTAESLLNARKRTRSDSRGTTPRNACDLPTDHNS